MQRCIECDLALRSIEMLEKKLCSVECETARFRRIEVPKFRASLLKPQKNGKLSKQAKFALKKEAVKRQLEERKKREMQDRLRRQDLSDPFFQRQDWRILRYQALKVYGRCCALCRETDGRMHVDHIKPRSKFPELALVFDNLQILCEACNLGKLNLDDTDFRDSVKVKV